MQELFFKLPPTLFKAVVPDLKLASEVPDDCKIYVFYVPGMVKYEDLKKALQEYGEAAGKNIFVGLWALDAEPYQSVLTYFGIKKSPALVIFGNPVFSTDGQKPTATAFARIDNPNLLNDVAKASDCINETCNLFMVGKVKDALSNARNDQYKSTLDHYFGKISDKISSFLKTHTITFDITKGQIIIAPAAESKASS